MSAALLANGFQLSRSVMDGNVFVHVFSSYIVLSSSVHEHYNCIAY